MASGKLTISMGPKIGLYTMQQHVYKGRSVSKAGVNNYIGPNPREQFNREDNRYEREARETAKASFYKGELQGTSHFGANGHPKTRGIRFPQKERRNLTTGIASGRHGPVDKQSNQMMFYTGESTNPKMLTSSNFWKGNQFATMNSLPRNDFIITNAISAGDLKETYTKGMSATGQMFRIKKKHEQDPSKRGVLVQRNNPDVNRRAETLEDVVQSENPQDQVFGTQGNPQGKAVNGGVLGSKDSTALASDGGNNDSNNMRKIAAATFNGKIPMKTMVDLGMDHVGTSDKSKGERFRIKKALTASSTEKTLSINQADFQVFEKFVTYSKREGTRRELEQYYIIGKTIGKGSYATVRLALSKETGQKVAIKTYEKSRLTDESRRKNVRRETEILDRANHPNIIRLQDFFHSESQVTKLLASSSLFHLVFASLSFVVAYFGV